MFRIGEFSRIARVSTRLLRYYDEIGLLRPCRIDARSGYRYYSTAQLQRLTRILVLRELGLSLDQIGKALADDISAAELRGMLLLRRSEVERGLVEQERRLRQIEVRIAHLDASGEVAGADVVLRAEPERRLLSTRAKLSSFAEGLSLARELLRELPQAAAASSLGELVAIAHAPEFDPEDLDVELGFYLTDGCDGDRVARTLSSGRVLSVRTLPAQAQVAACVRIGAPDHAHLATAQIGRFVEASGLCLAGPSREVFLRRPNPAAIDQAVVEMVFPVTAASSDGQ